MLGGGSAVCVWVGGWISSVLGRSAVCVWVGGWISSVLGRSVVCVGEVSSVCWGGQ